MLLFDILSDDKKCLVPDIIHELVCELEKGGEHRRTDPIHHAATRTTMLSIRQQILD